MWCLFPWLKQERIWLKCRKCGFDSWFRKIPWIREWLPTVVFSPGEFYGQRSLVGYSPWAYKELDKTEQLTLLLFHFQCDLSPYTWKLSIRITHRQRILCKPVKAGDLWLRFHGRHPLEARKWHSLTHACFYWGTLSAVSCEWTAKWLGIKKKVFHEGQVRRRHSWGLGGVTWLESWQYHQHVF